MFVKSFYELLQGTERERSMLAQILIVFGAALWGFLGTIHIIYPWCRKPRPSGRGYKAITRDLLRKLKRGFLLPSTELHQSMIP